MTVTNPMRLRMLVVTLGLCAAMGIPGCVDARDQARDEFQTHLTKVRGAIPAWYEAGNSDSLATLYDVESVLFLPETAPLEGVEAITAHWRDAFTDVHWEVQMETVALHVSPPVAVERGICQRRVVVSESNEVRSSDTGHYLRTWHYGLRGWKVQYEAVLRAQRNGE